MSLPSLFNDKTSTEIKVDINQSGEFIASFSCNLGRSSEIIQYQIHQLRHDLTESTATIKNIVEMSKADKPLLLNEEQLRFLGHQVDFLSEINQGIKEHLKSLEKNLTNSL
jgi:hypothetical protein